MKKYGVLIGLILMCAAFCFFFLIGLNMPGEIWPHIVGAGLIIAGLSVIFISDKLNGGSEKREQERKERNENLKRQNEALAEKLARDKAARDEMLKNIHH